MHPCCHPQALLLPSSIHLSLSWVSTMPTRIDIVGRRRAMLELDLIRQHVSIRRIEFQLVVVPEPVMHGAARDRANRRKRLLILCPHRTPEAGQRGGRRNSLDRLSSRDASLCHGVSL